jgi:hypothetical protein
LSENEAKIAIATEEVCFVEPCFFFTQTCYLQLLFIDKRLVEIQGRIKVLEMADQLNSGPGAAFELYGMSEELSEKLRFLDYEKELIGKVDGVKIVPS